MPDVTPLLKDRLARVNVPPAPPSLGVTVTEPLSVPFAEMVNALDATPTVPVIGPVMFSDVAGPDATVAVFDTAVTVPVMLRAVTVQASVLPTSPATNT